MPPQSTGGGVYGREPPPPLGARSPPQDPCRRLGQAASASARNAKDRGYRYWIDMCPASNRSNEWETPMASSSFATATAPLSREYSSFFPASSQIARIERSASAHCGTI